jgi:hypothetical protein
MNKKILFIIKERNNYGQETKPYGLINACNFIKLQLSKFGISCRVIEANTLDDIKNSVNEFNPDICFIEAIWISPELIKELCLVYPNIKWVIRLHSKVSFLASEKNAYQWINQYEKLRKDGFNISFACNNYDLFCDLRKIYKKTFYLPNIYYPSAAIEETDECNKKDKKNIHIGCFGALRVLKNHAQQAHWAIQFAEEINKKLHFHINVPEDENTSPSPVLRNLRAIFQNTKHVLVEHEWSTHEEFLNLVKQMDIGMQISFSETFNIVAADFVYCNVPIVVSEEINFVHPMCKVDYSNRKDVKSGLRWAYYGNIINLHKINKLLLKKYNSRSTTIWLEFIE